MELLESDSARPRQARYQAALRPDKLSVNSTLLCKRASISLDHTVLELCQIGADWSTVPNCAQFKALKIKSPRFIESGAPCSKNRSAPIAENSMTSNSPKVSECWDRDGQESARNSNVYYRSEIRKLAPHSSAGDQLYQGAEEDGSGDVAAGHILTQSPAPGTVVRRDWHVRVAESLGPQKVDVPDTVGYDQRVAAFQLRRSGLDVGVTAKLPDGGVAEGTVISQDPPAHAQGIERPSVNLLVAAPDDEAADGYVMPDLTGIPIVAAQAELAKVGVKTDTPTFVDVPVPPVGAGNALPVPPVSPGSVIAQVPAPGARVDLTMEVKLTVAK